MQRQPERTCVACRAKRAQSELLRVASHNGAAPIADDKAVGRGAYLCYAARCAQIAWKKRAFERALKLKAPLDAAFKTTVETLISAHIISQESQT